MNALLETAKAMDPSVAGRLLDCIAWQAGWGEKCTLFLKTPLFIPSLFLWHGATTAAAGCLCSRKNFYSLLRQHTEATSSGNKVLALCGCMKA